MPRFETYHEFQTSSGRKHRLKSFRIKFNNPQLRKILIRHFKDRATHEYENYADHTLISRFLEHNKEAILERSEKGEERLEELREEIEESGEDAREAYIKTNRLEAEANSYQKDDENLEKIASRYRKEVKEWERNVEAFFKDICILLDWLEETSFESEEITEESLTEPRGGETNGE